MGGSTTSKDDCGWCFLPTISSKLLSSVDSIMVFILDHIWLLKGTVVGRNPAPFYVRRFRFLFFTWFTVTLWWSNVCKTSKIMSCSNLMHHENRPLAWWVGKTSYFRMWKVRRLEITERWNLGWDGLTVGGWGGSHWRHRFWCARLERGRSIRLWQWAYYLLGLLLVRGRYSRQQVDVDMCLCLHTSLYIYKAYFYV